MSEVKSPYNFVPAPTEEQVFLPDWANQISHDVPFSDGESGEITLKITAETPIFIRNGHSKPPKEEKPTSEFSHVCIDGEKHYFIPATSIKGMLRNVLEIMSLSRLSRTLVSNDRYAFRDFESDSDYMNSYKSSEVRGGWLKENKDGSWCIEECEQIAFINHEEVDKVFNTSFRTDFLKKVPDDKSAKWKYLRCEGNPLQQVFATEVGGNNKVYARLSSEGRKGTVVFTGQASQRKESDDRHPSGKVNEFVFFSNSNPSVLPVSKEQKKDFRFIYLEHDSNNISTDWEYWRNKLRLGQKVPVFFSKNTRGELKHFGLSFMYKLPYRYSIHEMHPLRDYKYANDPTYEKDLAELIFGYVQKKDVSTVNKGQMDALKGRVMISHAFATKAESATATKEVLSGPKASFFPFYLDQSAGYVTYQNIATLRGFKRYPVHQNTPATPASERYDSKVLNNNKVFSEAIPLQSGSEFSCKIRFHNLRKLEIGALLSAITFHGATGAFHSLGGLKALGYGRTKLTIVALKNLKFEQDEYLKFLELEMRAQSDTWEKRVAELRTTATLQSPVVEKYLSYMPLDNFQKAKNKSSFKFLKPYSDIVGKRNTNQFFYNSYDILRLKEERRQRRKVYVREAERALAVYDFVDANRLFRDAQLLGEQIDWKIVEEKVAYYKQKKEDELQEKLRLSEVLDSRDEGLILAFIADYPLNNRVDELRSYLSNLKAASGLPERLHSLNDFATFSKEALRWLERAVKSGNHEQFIPELIVLLEKIILSELEVPRLKKNWHVELNDKKGKWINVSRLIGEENTKRLRDRMLHL